MRDNNGSVIRAVFLAATFLWIGGCNYQCTCFGLPRFHSVPTTVKTFENNTVSLPCVYSGPHLGIRWYFGDILLADSLDKSFYPSPINRIQMSSSNGSLTIHAVQSEDTGDYFCEVVLPDSAPLRQEHSIEVQFPPSVLSYPSGNLELKLGTTFEIVCEAAGVPHPIITWRRQYSNGDIEMLTETQRRLTVEVSGREAAGIYQCVANNGIEEPAVAGVNLQVNYVPEVQTPSSSVHTRIGYRANLECIVLASPSGKVSWYHHGVPLPMDNHIARSDVNMEDMEGSRHTLTIRSVRDRDLGMYECRAENKIGYKGVLINLNGNPKPSVFKPSPIASMGRNFNLLWQTESYSPISEYRLKFRLVKLNRILAKPRTAALTDWREITIPGEYSEAPIHTAAYSLPGLDVGTLYEVAVQSRNRYGWSEMSKTYRFATGGEVDASSKILLEAADGDDLNMENGGDLGDNSIDGGDAPGMFDYSFSGGGATHSATNFKLYSMILLVLIRMWRPFPIAE